MTDLLNKQAIKKILGELPLTAEVYYLLRSAGKPMMEKYSLAYLNRVLPGWCAQVEQSTFRAKKNGALGQKKVFLFGALHYWIEHITLVGCSLAGMGYQVTLAYLPYGLWYKSSPRFDLRRNEMYTHRILRQAEPVLKIVTFFDRGCLPLRMAGSKKLPAELEERIRHIAVRDTQYTLQMERVELNSSLHNLRLERDLEAACVAWNYLKTNRPDVVIVPNGTILEFGVVYQVAQYLQIPVVTYEFGEQRQRIWLAQNAEVMRQETNDLWKALGDRPLKEDQLTQVRQLFSARQHASLWENFARRWQGVPSEGGERVRAALNLDSRPVVLLATNVIGDSLTLDRQVFSGSMTEWIERTVDYFYRKPEVQFIIRIHPGELVTKGPSVADVVVKRIAALNGLPEGQVNSTLHFPEHIHLIPADAKVNTYDIVEIADLGLVYTTTVGMEMAMSGLPVIPSGMTHYRGKGFTLDADTWEAYFDLLSRILANPAGFRLASEKVGLAWNYAYRFFFDYPLPFPWHLAHMRKDAEEWPPSRVWSLEGQEKFGKTFRYLVGEPIQW